ncbi:hypothetical protein [Streptomyces aureoverticillatus]|uniref:hypothetical protein n=1 Tax=Streptomyces aureoverticillatus TaxID=66871 RepID=UPI0013D949FC|nr:hypothetical protein [Streptomyces aureoverticillatus]QIB47567.1 hypothetical protein G3H79_35320 [Streptomyces aureoverticillatus]
MATPRQGHRGDPYARDPGEFQIPYSWVPGPDASAPPWGDGTPADRGGGKARGRRRVRRGLLALVTVLVLGTAAAAAISADVIPKDSLPQWGIGPFPDRTHTSDASDTSTPTDTDTATVTETGTPTDTETDPGPGTETPTDTDSPTGPTRPAGTLTEWDALDIGDCASADSSATSALVVDCADAHRFELFATPDPYDAVDYPGDAVIQAHAKQQCRRSFAEFSAVYRGLDDLTWTAGTVTELAWLRDQPVHCYLMDDEGGSLYGSAVDDALGSDAIQ